MYIYIITYLSISIYLSIIHIAQSRETCRTVPLKEDEFYC